MLFPAAAAAATTTPLDVPIGAVGTISLQLSVDKTYSNGPGAEAFLIDAFEIPNIATLRFTQGQTVCELQWNWAEGIEAEDLIAQIPALPGPDTYFLQYTWDAPRGFFTGYVNGTALRLPGTALPPWAMPTGEEAHLAQGPITAELISAEARYMEAPETRKAVPEALLGRHARLFGVFEEPVAPIDIASRLGRELYASSLATPEEIAGWVMEGPGLLTFAEGWMEMASERPDSPVYDGHLVHWCPEDFPASFVAEWDVEIRSEFGLCIVFFAAQGTQGEDIFDPSLAKRDGTFRQYNRGDFSCYHVSYYANTPITPGRTTSNMRKNSGFYLVANGPPGIDPEAKGAHRIRLIKDDNHIQLQADGVVVIDFVDDGTRYGAVHGGGKIGFRQMQWTGARYRNLQVHELRAAGTSE